MMAEHTFTMNCLRLFAAVLRSKDFADEIDITKSKTLEVLQWIHECDLREAVELKELLVTKSSERTSNKNLQSLFKSGPPALRELGSNHLRQIFKVVLSFTMYGRKDRRIDELFDRFVLTGILRPSMFVGSKYIPAKTDVRASNHVETARFATKAPKPFEVIIAIHALNTCQSLYRRRGRRNGNQSSTQIKSHYQTSNRMGFAVQLLFNAWTALARSVGMRDFQELIEPYVLFDLQSGTFKVLAKREDGFAPKRQSLSLTENLEASRIRDLVDAKAFDRSWETDHAFRVISMRFFKDLEVLITHNYLYESADRDEDWDMLRIYRLRRETLPEVFCSLPKEVLGVIEVLSQGKERSGNNKSLTTEVIDVDGLTYQSGTDSFVVPVMKAISKRKAYQTKLHQSLKPTKSHILPKTSSRFIKLEDHLQPLVGIEKTEAISKSSRTRGEEDYNRYFETLFEFMSSNYCRIHDVPFSDLIDTDAETVGYYLNEKVDFIVTDPPYNTRNQRGAENSSHDVLTDSDMRKCVELFDVLLKKGGHGVIFCSSLQFHRWYETLKNFSKFREDVDSDESSQPLRRMKIRPFHVEEVMMHFQSSPGHFNHDPARKNLSHMSVVQTAIHFWKKGNPSGESRKPLQYENQGYIPSRHAAWTNCIDNIPRLSPEEVIYFPKGIDGTLRMIRPEQKSVMLLMEIISQYTREGDLVADVFGGTFSAAKACLKLPKHRKFVGCDFDVSCVKLAIPSLLVSFASQICSNESNISAPKELKEVASAFLEHPRLAAKEAHKHASRWDAPAGLPLYQRLPEHVHKYLASETMDSAIYFQYRHVPLDKWPNKFRGYLNISDINALLNIEAAAKGLVVCKSSVRHKFAGTGVFAARSFKEGEQVLTYYGTIVYRDLCLDTVTTKEYGSGVLAVRKNRFERTAVQLLSKAEDDDGKAHKAFIVPAPFCVASHINDPRYLPGDLDSVEKGTLRERRANVVFAQSPSKPTKKGLRSNKLIVVEACRNISVGEELFVDYGSKYMSWGADGEKQ